MGDFFILPSLRRARGGAVVKFVEDCSREMVGVLPSSWTCLFTDIFKCLGVIRSGGSRKIAV